MDFPNKRLPDTLYGTVDVTYVEAVLPEGSGEATAIGVTVHSGLFNDEKRQIWVNLHLPATVYLPIGRVNFIDIPPPVDNLEQVEPEDPPPFGEPGEPDPNKDPNE